ncbi:MAG: hypothetical protein ABI295_12150, partial [Xanthomarina sp.]
MISLKIKQQKTIISKVILLALLVTFSVSCSPEDGKDGADGNANIFVSDWFQIQFDEINADNDEGVMIIPLENFDAYIGNGGVAIMYAKEESLGQFAISPLPIGDTFTFYVGDTEDTGKAIVFYASTSDVSFLENNPMATLKY